MDLDTLAAIAAREKAERRALADALAAREAALCSLAARARHARHAMAPRPPTHEWRGTVSRLYAASLEELIAAIDAAARDLEAATRLVRAARLAVDDSGG